MVRRLVAELARRVAAVLALVVVLGLAVLADVATTATGAAAAGQPLPPPPTRPPLPPPTTRPGLPPPTSAPGPGPTPTGPPLTQTFPRPSQPPPTTVLAPADDGASDGGGALPLLAVAAVAALLGGAAAIALRSRNRPEQGPSTPTPPRSAAPTPAPSGPGAVTHELLEVSRQLTAASVTGDVKRATVRGAMSLVPADGAALLTVEPTGGLTIAVESTPGLLVPEQLGDGVLGRVAETGDFVELVSSSEPAIRNRPASVLAMPLVAGGRVAAVLVVVRSKDQPFIAAETNMLRALAPMAAAVLQSERHAQSAIEDSLVDPLTSANNRRRFDRDIDSAMQTMSAGAPVSLAIVDLDHFKRVNDSHGHPAGDALLKAVVATVQDSVRPGDGVYRFGGEEFCILFRDTSADAAVEVAERVRAAIAARTFDVGAAEPLVATASIGVAAAISGDTADLLARADAALYRAKEAGRDRVVSG